MVPGGKGLADDPRGGAVSAWGELTMRHILSILVDEAGALSRISGLFWHPGYDRIADGGTTEDVTMSPMTICALQAVRLRRRRRRRMSPSS